MNKDDKPRLNFKNTISQALFCEQKKNKKLKNVNAPETVSISIIIFVEILSTIFDKFLIV